MAAKRQGRISLIWALLPIVIIGVLYYLHNPFFETLEASALDLRGQAMDTLGLKLNSPAAAEHPVGINGNPGLRGGGDPLIDFGMISALGFVGFLVTTGARYYFSLPFLVIVAGIYGGGSHLAFLSGYGISLFYPLACLLLAHVVAGLMSLLGGAGNSEQIQSVFGGTVSDKIMGRLTGNPKAVNVDGGRREVTIVSADIKGFANYVRLNSPVKVVALMNKYLAVMVNMIMKFEGTVGGFLGQGITAYWGAPLALDNHAEQAVKCILAMHQKMEQLGGKGQRSGEPVPALRVGIHSGQVVGGIAGLGNQRKAYSLIGDNVNLAARFEETSRFHGVNMVVSEGTYKLTKEKFIYRELDRIRFESRNRPLTVYELLGASYYADSKRLKEIAEKFQEAMSLYYDRQWDKALEIFQMFSKVDQDDLVPRRYVQRCKYFLDNPPPPEWDGVFEILSTPKKSADPASVT